MTRNYQAPLNCILTVFFSGSPSQNKTPPKTNASSAMRPPIHLPSTFSVFLTKRKITETRFGIERVEMLLKELELDGEIEKIDADVQTSSSAENIATPFHYGDLPESTNLVYILAQVLPFEIYNLGAQSHVKVSFDMTEYTTDINGLGTLHLFDAICTAGLEKHARFYQASTSKLYGEGSRDAPGRDHPVLFSQLARHR
ncbi:hypothetical protein C8R48DRAFT_774676 [Suillus tomentosus]|nr:hypothetical protein C8R48DRAFT_774676 [Suillus tomentosus]